MKMKTLAQVKPKAYYTFDPVKVGLHRPNTLAKVARCISLWAQCEAMVGQVVAYSFKGDSRLAMDMYLSITSPGAASGVRRIVTRSLPKDYQEILEALMLLGKPLYDERSRLAHWLIGYSKELKHSLLLLDPRDGLRQLTHNVAVVREREFNQTRHLSPNEIKVLSGSYLNDLAKRISHHYLGLSIFTGTLWQQEGGEWSDEITERQFRWLYSDPQIAATLARLRGEKPSKSKSRRSQRKRAARKSS